MEISTESERALQLSLDWLSVKESKRWAGHRSGSWQQQLQEQEIIPVFFFFFSFTNEHFDLFFLSSNAPSFFHFFDLFHFLVIRANHCYLLERTDDISDEYFTEHTGKYCESKQCRQFSP